MDSIDRLDESIEVKSAELRLSDILDDEISAAVEAVLFASPNPLSASQIAKLVGGDKNKIPAIIEQLNGSYAQWRRSFRIERFGDGFRFYTVPEFDKYISRLAEIPRPAKLSRAALEVLAIIAYRQPVMKSEVERLRGIDSDGVIRTLLERGLIAIGGRSDGPGRPLLYRTTQEFLEFFGISDLSQLPSPDVAGPDQIPAVAVTLKRPPEKPGSDNLDQAE